EPSRPPARFRHYGPSPSDGVPVIGMSIAQVRPAGRKSKLTLAPGMAPRISAVPKPALAGSLTGGPPVSSHVTTTEGDSFRCATLQLRFTCPFGVERAPYLAAFVANSCKTRPNGVATRALSKTAGPSIETRGRVPPRYASSW